MSVDIDAREVLNYLNDLGYYNITGKQLKEFVKDLKTLIKYDQKKAVQKENQENIAPTHSHSCYVQKNKENVDHYEFDVDKVTKQLNINADESVDTFNNLHSTSTISSRAKIVPKKQNIISVQILKPKTTRQPHLSCSGVTEPNTKASSEPNYPSRDDDLCRSSVSESTQTTKYMKKDVKSKSADCVRADKLKPRVSFIRPRQPVKTCKSDPVSLYQQYQAEWSRQKLPGQDKHYDLRWAIRERMLGEPDIRPHPLHRKQSRI